MKRKTEYVTYYAGDVSEEGLDGADVDGGRNKRQADKEIKEMMESGRLVGAGECLLAVRKYLWVGEDGYYELYEDELYWCHPNLYDNGEGDGYQ